MSEAQPPPKTAGGEVLFRAAVRDDAPALSTFLQGVFRVPATAMLLDQRHLAWKYWSEREDWTGPRSFTARRDGAIVAHVAAWPVRIQLPDRVLSAAHLIDWASDPRYPGAGLWLMWRMRPKVGLLIATGGTEITRRTLPVFGFRPFGEICSFARPLRPFGQSRTQARMDWRLAGRLVRNSAWRWSAPVSAPAGWSGVRIDPDDIDETIWPRASDNTAVAVRTGAFYRYILASPLTRFALFGLRRRGTLVGYFCLAYARHVARHADLWVASTDPDDWCAAYRTACETATCTKDVHEISAWTSTPIGRDALGRAGFRLRDSSTLSVFGDAAPLAGRDLHIQMLDCDASFLAADELCYLT
jgi:hypothetical protein